MDPFTMSLISGGLNAGMGLFGASQKRNAQQQKYLSDLAFQNANNRFSIWQAGFSARVQDANKQHQFWKETFNYNQQRVYAKSQQNIELMREADQALVVGQTRAAAGAAYANDSAALSDQLAEAEMASAVAQQQYTWRALSARASVQAMNMEGNSVDRVVNNYAFQLGDQLQLKAIESDLRERQYNRAQAGQVAQYLSRWNSQTLYEAQQINEPFAPFAPLPTMITPPPPSRTGAPPSNAAFAMDIGSTLIGGVSAGMSTYGSMKRLQTPSSNKGPGTGSPWGGLGQLFGNYTGLGGQ